MIKYVLYDNALTKCVCAKIFLISKRWCMKGFINEVNDKMDFLVRKLNKSHNGLIMFRSHVYENLSKQLNNLSFFFNRASFY